jgi:hypothetical protein
MVFIILFIINIFTSTFTTFGSTQAQPEVNSVDANFFRYFSQLKMPDSLDFCGEHVPTEIPEVKERAEREFYVNLQQPGQLILNLKRAGRYFPLFERILKAYGMPDDIKYLAVAESALYQARSPKGAVGLWQFIPETGRIMGLQVDDFVDERRDPEKSTEAAMKYLKQGYDRFKSWSMAAAGYNMGYVGLDDNATFQGSENYFDLFLNEETSRYVLRIAILKEIMEHAGKYGISLNYEDLYRPESYKIVKWNAPIPDLAQWAKQQGTTYKDVKLLNPWILNRKLPAPAVRTYEIKIPSLS